MYPISDVKAAKWGLSINDGDPRDPVASAALLPLAPVFRGFWLDDQLMTLAGISSVAVLKKLQAAEAIKANYIALPDGGRRRAWSTKNAFRALFAKEVAERGRMSLMAAGLLLGKIGAGFVDRELELDQLFAALQRRIEAWAKVSNYRGQLPGTVSEGITGTAGSPELIFVNWQDVRFAKAQQEYSVAYIRKLDGAAPQISSLPKGCSAQEVTVTARILIQPIVTKFILTIAH